jgi:hypothetical protein
MKEIKLTQGYLALVDDDDFDKLSRYKWHVKTPKGSIYAARTINVHGKLKTVLMHRQILNVPDNLQIDHIDHNGLNCQKHNMRICTINENLWNKRSKGKSKYHGVSFIYNTDGKKYIKAQICKNKKYEYLGTYKTEELAARGYDIRAKELFGEYANLNFKYENSCHNNNI